VLLVEDVAHVQAAGRGDAGKREHHHPDQRSVPWTHHVVGFDGAQQLALLLGGQHGGLALAQLLARGLHGERRVVLDHAPRHQVVEQHADGGPAAERIGDLWIGALTLINYATALRIAQSG
jgi:hypothetical protein